MPDNSDLPSIPFFVERILSWYVANGRHSLPWRKAGITPYEVWVSEVMLQQTQVSRVISYYERFLERFPTAAALAAASWEEFLPYYQGLGYYQRGRNMLATAKIVEFLGGFPSTYEDLRKLPGVGDYTARAILSFGFGLPFLAFDTNHQRVWGRYLYGSKFAPVDREHIEHAIPSNTNFSDLNAAIMDFANLVYTNTNPQIEDSPLQPHCVFWQTRGALEPTSNAKKSAFPHKSATTYLVLHEKHRAYFSLNPQKFEPFLLPTPINTRHQIQEYFLRQHGLTLAVRPPKFALYLGNQPIHITYAQILAGAHSFTTHTKEAHLLWRNAFLQDTIPADS